MPQVSILIAIYNAEPYLRRCLDSILAQTMEDWECVLVNDGSKDNSGKICDEYAIKDPRFRVCHKENEGVSATREKALQMSSGEYVIHADPDDWVEPDMLRELYQTATFENADMVICDFIEHWGFGENVQEQEPTSLDHVQVLRDLYGNLHGSCCNKLVRRSLFDKFNIHFPPGMNFCEDLYVNTSLLKNNIKVTYLPKAFYHYDHTTNPSSIVNNKSKAVQRATVKAEGLRSLLEDEYPELFEKILFFAKRQFLESGMSYDMFINQYKDINAKIYKLEKAFSSGSVVSFAIQNRACYWMAYAWLKFKDLCFIVRHSLK